MASLVVNDGKVSSATTTVTISATNANAAPVANAGVAQNVLTTSVVTIDGSASTDANGDVLTYAWTLTSKPVGSTATLTSATSAKPTFIADIAGTYVASLVVNDGKVSSIVATTSVAAVARIAGSFGLMQTGFISFCDVKGTSTFFSTSGNGTWTFNNCSVYGTAGSIVFARIQNNGTTSLQLDRIDIQAGIFAKSWSIGDASKVIAPKTTSDFPLPLWLGMEVTNAKLTFFISGENNLIVDFSGNMSLP